MPSPRSLPLLLLALAGRLAAQDGFPIFTQDFPPEEFAARRQALAERIGPGTVALLQGAPSPDAMFVSGKPTRSTTSPGWRCRTSIS